MDAGFPFSMPPEPSAFRAWSLTLLALIVLLPVIGRSLLAALPVGLPGRHVPRDLPATWAASGLLGLSWLLVLAAWDPPRALHPWIALGLPAAVLVARLATLPGSLVPRHDPIPTRWCAGGRALAFAAAAVLAAHAWQRADVAGAITAWCGAVSAVLVVAALATAGAPARIRGAAALFVASIVAVRAETLPADAGYLLVAGAGASAGAVSWIRRGDRRGLALASVALLLAVHLGPVGLALGLGLGASLVVGSAQRSRGRAANWIGTALAIGAAAHTFGRTHAERASYAPLDVPWTDHALAGVLAAAFGAAWILRRRGSAPTWNPSGAPEGREATVLLGGVVAGALLSLAAAALGVERVGSLALLTPQGFPTLAGIATVAAGIVLARGLERASKPA